MDGSAVDRVMTRLASSTADELFELDLEEASGGGFSAFG
jgi:hypothetical protein